jgi:aryl-alcohol dehydrogenase-like predicted oxidoreductase
MSSSDFTRRTFLRSTVIASGLYTFGAWRAAIAAEPRNGIPYRKLGRTGAEVSALGIGGFHLGMKPTEEEAIRIVRTALDSGINFLDNCWDYNDGKSEVRMGKALRDGYRDKAFLMTKIDGRTKDMAAKQIDESLQRLQTDHLDLLQMHEVIRETDPERVFGEGGGWEAMAAAQKAGKARFFGFTGHKSPDIHLKMLKTAAAHGIRFDTVQMPLNVMDAHFNSFEKKVVPELVNEEIGVLGMKPMGSGKILESKAVEATECLHYAMSLPVSVTITGCDSMAVLEQALKVAKGFKPYEPNEITALLARTAPVAEKGQFELYKTSQRFDATATHPQWLG